MRAAEKNQLSVLVVGVTFTKDKWAVLIPGFSQNSPPHHKNNSTGAGKNKFTTLPQNIVKSIAFPARREYNQKKRRKNKE